MAIFDNLSVDQLSKILSISRWGLAIFGIVTVSAGILNQYISDRISSVQKSEKIEAKTRQQEAEQTLRDARADAAAAKILADELQSKQRPRVIADDQRRMLIAALKDGPKGKVIVTFLSVERDAQKYAEQITSVLTEAGYEVTLSKKIWLQLALDGIYIAAKEKDVAPQHGIFIQQCFKDAGIPVGGFYDPKFLTEVGAADDSIVFAISNRH